MKIRILKRDFDFKYIRRMPRFYDKDCEYSVNGYCQNPITHKKPKIRVREGLHPKEELETVIHEITHGGRFSASEEFVTEFARDLTEVLWAEGWRKM